MSELYMLVAGLKLPVPKSFGAGRLCLRQPCFRENKRTVGWASARLLTIYAGMKDLVVDLFCVSGRLKPTLRGSER